MEVFKKNKRVVFRVLVIVLIFIFPQCSPPPPIDCEDFADFYKDKATLELALKEYFENKDTLKSLFSTGWHYSEIDISKRRLHNSSRQFKSISQLVQNGYEIEVINDNLIIFSFILEDARLYTTARWYIYNRLPQEELDRFLKIYNLHCINDINEEWIILFKTSTII